MLTPRRLLDAADVTPLNRGYAPGGRRFNRRSALRLALAGAAGLIGGPAAMAETTGAATPTAAAPIKLIAFGDSLIAGFGLAQGDGFVPQLQAWLEAQGAGPVTVVNAGVSGDTTSGGLARLDWAVTPDADAVLLELGANDMLRGVDPKIAEANLDQMLTRLTKRDLPVLLAGMPSLGNWGPEYKQAFEAMYPALAEKHGVRLFSFLGAVAGEPGLNQPDGIHPNKRGVAKIVETVGPAVVALIAEARRRKAAR